MPTSRPFAYNTGVQLSGTIQLGDLAIGGSGTKNILAIKTLLSKTSGVLVTQSECQTVVDNFIRRVKESQNF